MQDGTARRHGLAINPRRCLQASLVAMLACLLLLPGSGLAAPGTTEPALSNGAVNLGGGTYRVTASVFAEGTDGQVGTQASSGHLIQPDDNLVALPACTASSCPWVSIGTGPEGAYGPQTDCAEADGLCWVQIVSDSTGMCTVAPVHDRGPLFVRDNWWAPQDQRTYSVPQGVPAAEHARDGVDLGFGPGQSDVGYDIQNVYRYAAGIDLAAGTWKALGLPVSAGISTVTVTMLWQAGIPHTQACGGSPSVPDGAEEPEGAGDEPAAPPPAVSGESATVIGGALNLRSEPDLGSSVLTILPGDAQVTLTGNSSNGFLSVSYNGIEGWAAAEYISTDSAPDGEVEAAGDESPVITGTALVTSELNLRSGAGTDFDVLAMLPTGTVVDLTGGSQNGFLSLYYQGQFGWAAEQFLDTSGEVTTSASEPVPEPPITGTASAIVGLNLRGGPGLDYGILAVIPAGGTVQLTGKTEGGFAEAVYNGEQGWVSAQFLTTGGALEIPSGPTVSAQGPGIVIDGALNLRAGPSMAHETLAIVPGNSPVSLLGQEQNGFLKVVYDGIEGWASAQFIQVGTAAAGEVSVVTATVFDGALNLRSGPGSSHSVVTVMPDGAQVTLTGQSENGYESVSYDGMEGWAAAEFLD